MVYGFYNPPRSFDENEGIDIGAAGGVDYGLVVLVQAFQGRRRWSVFQPIFL
jgi:hypothetical protein